MHKWAKEITHFVNGGEVESRYVEEYRQKWEHNSSWDLVEYLDAFDNDNFEFRIKPQKKTMEVAVYASDFCSPNVWIVGDELTSFKRLSDIVTIEYEDLS